MKAKFVTIDQLVEEHRQRQIEKPEIKGESLDEIDKRWEQAENLLGPEDESPEFEESK